jgi:hypothetical protein
VEGKGLMRVPTHQRSATRVAPISAELAQVCDIITL